MFKKIKLIHLMRKQRYYGPYSMLNSPFYDRC